MATQYTSLLGFALPVTGELSGTWGDTVNNSITQLVEDSVAGVATQSVASADWTLSTTGSGQTNQARCAILRPTGSSGVARNIIAPSSSKAYIVDNQSNVAVTVKGAATTGVAVAAGTAALVAWNGSDFVLVAQNLANATGTLSVSNGGTGQTTYTDGQLLIGNSTGNTLTKATLTQGSGVTITNGNGSITIAATGSGGTVTNVGTSNGPAPINGLTLTGGPITGSGTVTLGGGVNASTITTGVLPVANGGTGLSTVGSSGNVLTSNGTAWVSQAAGGGANIQSFSVTGTYTKPAGAKFVMVEVWSAGGGGSTSSPATTTAYGGSGGGGGAYTYRMFAAPEIGATETVTIGAGGAGGASSTPVEPARAGANGGTTNFGSLLFAYGGGGGGGDGSPGNILSSPGAGGSIINARIREVNPFSASPSGNQTDFMVSIAGQNNNFVYSLGVWGGGIGGSGPNGPGPNQASYRGGGSIFGGGGGGGGSWCVLPPGATENGGQGGRRLMGGNATWPDVLSTMQPAPRNFVIGSGNGGNGGIAFSPNPALRNGQPGGNFEGGGGGTGNNDPSPPFTGGYSGGNGGLAGGGGAGGALAVPSGQPNISGGAGGNGGNGYVIVYTW